MSEKKMFNPTNLLTQCAKILINENSTESILK